MKFVHALGIGIFLCSVSLLPAGGGAKPKAEDVPKYMAQLKSANATDRAKAAEMLGLRGGIKVSDVEDAVEPLKKMLEKDKDAKVRSAAARALGAIQLDAEGTVPLLIDRLKSESEEKEVRMSAVVALGQYGPDAKEALPPLRDYLKKFDPKKSKEGPTIQNAIQMISMAKKKKA
jgi:HEAT repeat protein